jgi:HEAT repeat protein
VRRSAEAVIVRSYPGHETSGAHAGLTISSGQVQPGAAAIEDAPQEAQNDEEDLAEVAQEKAEREQEVRQREGEKKERQQGLYDDGSRALDEHRWEKAIDSFGQVARDRGPRADGALYWKAYAENKLGRRDAALVTVAELRKSYPQSRWLNDAKALEVEVRQASGQRISPDAESNDDLKLIAINSLMGSDPEKAVPLLQKLLEGSQPIKVKERALFVLSQSGSPQAREVVAQIARGGSNPDLQQKALQDLALFGGKESHQTLADIYASTTDPDVKRTILHCFMLAGERERLLAAAKGEKSADLRAEAVGQLGVMGARAELWQLYQSDSSAEVRKHIVNAMFIGGDAEHLGELARTEKNPEVRGAAIHSLGLMGADRAGSTLVSLYGNEKDAAVRGAIIEGLFLQNNGKALVELARKEKDTQIRRQMIEKLSLMHSREATDYMMELLK